MSRNICHREFCNEKETEDPPPQKEKINGWSKTDYDEP
jgi:hypothetical protein